MISELARGVAKFRAGPCPTKEGLAAAHPDWALERLERVYMFKLTLWARTDLPPTYDIHART